MTNQTDMDLTAVRAYAAVRTGTVVSFTSGAMVVDVNGVNVRAGYLTSYGATVGDLVALLLQDASWLVLGKVAGV